MLPDSRPSPFRLRRGRPGKWMAKQSASVWERIAWSVNRSGPGQEIAAAGARAAKRAAVDHHLALEVDPFPALGANHARPFESGEVLGLHLHRAPAGLKQLAVGHHRVSLLLAEVLVHLRKHFPGALLGAFLRRHADGAVGLQIYESGGNL